MLTISQKTMKQFTKHEDYTALSYVLYETSGALVATDGVQLVKIYIEPIETLTQNVLLPITCFPSKTGYSARISLDGNGNYIVAEVNKKGQAETTRIVPICETGADMFPDYNKVFPSSEPSLPTAKIKFDPSRLLAFDALKTELVGKGKGVELTFYGENSPIQIDINGHFTGLSMPMKR